MTLYTNPDLLPYPDDYEQPADVPLAIKDLADAVQATFLRDRLHRPRRHLVREDPDVSVPSGVLSVLRSWQAGSSDQGNGQGVLMYSGSGVITVAAASIIEVTAYCVWAANSTGERRIEILQGGTAVWRDTRKAGASGTYSHTLTVTQWAVPAGDTLTMGVWQTSGAALDMIAARMLIGVIEPWT